LPGGYTGKPEDVVKTVRVRATVLAVDLEERSIRVVPAGYDQHFRIAVMKGPEPLEWGVVNQIDLVFFGQPKGTEKIHVSKKAAKRLGKSSIRLEELKSSSTVKAEIYPFRSGDSYRVAAQQLTVEALGE
jgi:hypothetical protein